MQSGLTACSSRRNFQSNLITISEIDALVRPVLEQERVHLCGIKVSGRAGKPFIQIFVDYEESHITIDECARLSRLVQDVLDMQPRPLLDYRLEISSPGLDWPLTEVWQFRKNLGRRIAWRRADNTRTKGELVGIAEDGNLVIEVNGGLVQMPLDSLVGAVVLTAAPQPKPGRSKIGKQKTK